MSYPFFYFVKRVQVNFDRSADEASADQTTAKPANVLGSIFLLIGQHARGEVSMEYNIIKSIALNGLERSAHQWIDGFNDTNDFNVGLL